jgi:hypothetical protein
MKTYGESGGPGHCMEVCVQFHSLTALLPLESPPAPITHWVRLRVRVDSMEKRKVYYPARNRSWAVQLAALRIANRSIGASKP